MATNGASARLWLKENQNNLPAERVQQVIRSIHRKIESLNENHPDNEGLLEALDVLELFLNKVNTPDHSVEGQALPLDSSPLIPDSPSSEALSPEEKQRRFELLLKKSDI